MPKMVESYYQRVAKAQKMSEDADLKRAAFTKKAKEVFGFELHPNDPRLAKFLADEKLAKKKETKEAKKKDKAVLKH